MLAAHRALGAASPGALRARPGRRARRGARPRSALGQGRAARPARRRAGHDQGEHRDPRHAGAARHGGHRAVPGRAGRAAGARLREAGAVILGKTTMPDYGMLSSGLSSFHTLTRNPWDLRKNPGGSSAGAGAAARRRLRPAARRHRHRRLAAPAGRLVRHLHAEAQPRPHPDRPAVRRPRRRADDAHGRRCGADDGGAAQPDERDTMSLPSQDIAWTNLGATARPAHRPAAGCRRGPAGRARGARRGRSGGAALRAAGAIVEPMQPFMTRAMLDGMDAFWRMRSWLDIEALPPEQRAKVLPYIARLGRGGAKLSGERRVPRLQPVQRAAPARGAACRPFDYVLSPTAPIPAFAGRAAPARPTTRSGRSSTSASRCRTT